MASILVIDDSGTIQELVSAILGSQGHQVAAAADMAQGLRCLRRAEFDLLLLDLNLPKVRGEADVEFIRERMGVKTPIIILSGEITQETILGLTPFEVSAYVAKDGDFGPSLAQEVANVLWFGDG